MRTNVGWPSAIGRNLPFACYEAVEATVHPNLHSFCAISQKTLNPNPPPPRPERPETLCEECQEDLADKEKDAAAGS